MARYDIRVGVKDIVGDSESRSHLIEHVIKDGNMMNVMTYISSILEKVKGSIENLYHLEIYERD